MKWLPVVLFFLFVIGLSLGAGCTQSALPEDIPATPVPSLADFALTAADAPGNYTLVESRAKTADEVGSLAKDLGWQGGYVVTYSGMPDHPMGATEITQTITTYPASGMADIVAFVDTTDQSDPELVVTNLPSPSLGEYSHAFSGKAISQIVFSENKGDPLGSGSLKGSLKHDRVEIIFAKDSTLEVLKMTGPNADYATLKALSGIAYAKLP